MGVSLTGGKADKACVAVLDFYPAQKKVFLSKLIERIKTEEFISADLKIHEILLQYEFAKSVAFDVPLSLPKCVTCKLVCPGYEVCTEPEIKYMQKLYRDDRGKKKPKKMYTPYTQRAVDAYWHHQEPELDMHHALGANLAPMTARGIFVARRLNLPRHEVFPKLVVWRLGQELKLNKSRLKSYRNAVGGDEARAIFLVAATEKWNLFLYEEDRKILVENVHAFEAFICAYAAYLESQAKNQKRPVDLPKGEAWILAPDLR